MKVSRAIRELIPYKPGKPIEEAKRELGLTHVVKLASNESPLGASPRVVAAVQAHLGNMHRYPDAAAHDATEAVSRHYGLSTNRIAFGNGSNELVDLLIRIFCEARESILTSRGAFAAYRISAQAARVRTIETPLTAAMTFDVPALIEQIHAHQDIRLVFLPNPNNPTGAYLTRPEVQSILDAAAHRDVLVVFDEAYVEFVRAADYGNGSTFLDQYPHAVTLRTFSKAYGLAGLRIGVLLGPQSVVDLVHRVRNPFNVNALAQVAVAAALEDREHLQRVLELTWQGLDFFYDRCAQMGLPVTPSQGNFVLIDCRMDSDLVFRALLREGFITRPVKEYGWPMHLRLSVGLPEENRGVMDALERVLTAAPSS